MEAEETEVVSAEPWSHPGVSESWNFTLQLLSPAFSLSSR